MSAAETQQLAKKIGNYFSDFFFVYYPVQNAEVTHLCTYALWTSVFFVFLR